LHPLPSQERGARGDHRQPEQAQHEQHLTQSGVTGPAHCWLAGVPSASSHNGLPTPGRHSVSPERFLLSSSPRALPRSAVQLGVARAQSLCFRRSSADSVSSRVVAAGEISPHLVYCRSCSSSCEHPDMLSQPSCTRQPQRLNEVEVRTPGRFTSTMVS
jgi:hypothetical protein